MTIYGGAIMNNHKVFELYETIDEGLRLIDSVSCLVVQSMGNSDEDTISDAMLIIGKLMTESANANDELLELITGDNPRG